MVLLFVLMRRSNRDYFNLTIVFWAVLMSFSQLSGQTDESPVVFDVTIFGANGADILDDRKAIQAAIDAASENGGGVVYFPAGTYRVSPPGKAVIDIYRKLNGSWSLQNEKVDAGQSIDSWVFLNTKPEIESAVINSKCVSMREGNVYQKINGE